MNVKKERLGRKKWNQTPRVRIFCGRSRGRRTGCEAGTRLAIFLLDQTSCFVAALGFFYPALINLPLDFNNSFLITHFSVCEMEIKIFIIPHEIL